MVKLKKSSLQRKSMDTMAECRSPPPQAKAALNVQEEVAEIAIPLAISYRFKELSEDDIDCRRRSTRSTRRKKVRF